MAVGGLVVDWIKSYVVSPAARIDMHIATIDRPLVQVRSDLISLRDERIESIRGKWMQYPFSFIFVKSFIGDFPSAGVKECKRFKYE